MKPITDYLSWPVTDDLAAVLTNLSWEKKFELSVALGQMALGEKQGKEAWDRIQALDSIEKHGREAWERFQALEAIDSTGISSIASPAPRPIAPLAPKAIEPPEKSDELPT
jgi:hypothetical protein